MLLSLILLPCLLHLSLVTGSSAAKLNTIYEWKYIDYVWDSEADRAAAIKSGEYNKTKPIVIDVDVWRNRKVFVTLVRGEGVPASLTTVSNKFGDGGPLLQPYPAWSWARRGDCNEITNVYRVAIDECDRLWVMDNGQIGGVQVCQPQLLAFDLKTDDLLTRVKIPNSVSQNSETKIGMLITPIVETSGYKCKRTHVYIADVTGHALVVWNGESLWRLQSPVFSPQASATNVEIAGESFDLDDGVLGMALSPRRNGQSRFLMFRPFASLDMNYAETSNLQNSYNGGVVTYSVASRALSSPAVAMAFSSQGVLFFALTKETALACWNMDKSISRENIVMVEQNRETIQFASGLKVIQPHITGGSEQIWMVTNRYQKMANGTQNFDEVNFRVMAGYVEDLIAGTKCDPKPMLASNYYWNYRDSSSSRLFNNNRQRQQ